ncbi:MAG: DNA repair protein RecO [Mariprofundaceae bacterium]|nr:DNA repair protein RecO [Mariprofundaceae bacterium]
MSEFLDQAILLRSIPYRETSCILHLLTARDGRLSLLVRGVRKKKSVFRSELAPLHLLSLRWKKGRSDLGYVQELHRLKPLLSEENYLDALKLNSLAYVLFPEREPMSMSLLCEAYALLEQRRSGLLVAVWYLLAKHGWLGELHHCWHCMAEDSPLLWSQASCCCQACGQGMVLSKGLCLSIEFSMRGDNIRLSHAYTLNWMQMIQDILAQHGLKRLNFE